MSVLEDMAVYAEANGFGTQAVNLFISRFPSSPANLISLSMGTPFETVDTMGGVDHEQPVVYAMVRDTDHSVGLTKAYGLFGLFHRFRGTMNGTTYLSILARTPSFLGADENQRFRWSLSFNTRRRM